MYTYLFDWDIYNLREEFDELKTKTKKIKIIFST